MCIFPTITNGTICSLPAACRIQVFTPLVSAACSRCLCQSYHSYLSKDSMNDFRSGFIAIIGRPNVGKSTLVNALLSQKIAAVSPKPQTTRKRQLGILTAESYQLVFVDTPGMHTARHKLGQFLNKEAEESLAGVDVVVWLVDSAVRPTDEDKQIGLLLTKLPLLTQPEAESVSQSVHLPWNLLISEGLL